MKNRSYIIKRAAFALVILFMLITMLSLFISCSELSDGSNQEAGVLEPDVIKVTDDGHIIKLQRDGMTVTKAENGALRIIKSKKSDFLQKPIDLIMHSGIMIAVVEIPSGEYSTVQLQFYDMDDLNDGTNRLETVRATNFYGEYFTCRIYDGSVYFFAKSFTKYVKFDEEKKQYVETNKTDYVHDSIEGEKAFTPLTTSYNKDDRPLFGGYLLSKLDLGDLRANKYSLTSYRSNDVSSLYFSPHGVYFTHSAVNDRGCDNTSQYYIAKISNQDLSLAGVTEKYNGTIINRYCLYDNGKGYLFSVSTGPNALTVFDSQMKQASVMPDVAGGAWVTAVNYEEDICYISTATAVDPVCKIDISSPLSPEMKGYVKVEGVNSHLFPLWDSLVAGIGNNTDGSTKVTLMDMSEDTPYDVNTRTLDVKVNANNIRRKAISLFADIEKFGVCTGGSAYIFSVDEYGFLSHYIKLSPHIYGDDLLSAKFNIEKIALFDGFIYTISEGSIASYNISDFSFHSAVDTRQSE